MKKLLKVIMYILGFFGILVLIVVVWWNISSYYKNKKKERDSFAFQKICDSTKIVVEQPEITFFRFKGHEISPMKFEILRNGKIENDTTVASDKDNLHAEFKNVNIPFPEFLKSDTIVLTTRNKLKFYIAGFHHYAYLHHGMFGYLGSYDCRFAKDFTVNKLPSNGSIIPKHIMTDAERNDFVAELQPLSKELDAFSQKAKISEQEAEKIAEQHKKIFNRVGLSFYGVRIQKSGTNYIFREEMENGEEMFIKINAETGAVKRSKKIQ